jgi:hypothetical protein
MATVREAVGIKYAPPEPASYFHDILAPSHSGGWDLKLPPGLESYRSELEALLGKVFEGKGRSGANLELAQQMTLNWCMSKCRKLGIGLDEGFLA